MMLFQPSFLGNHFSQPRFVVLAPKFDETNRTKRCCPNRTNTNTMCQSLKSHVNELDKYYQLSVDAPGVKASDVQVEIVTDSSIRITIEKTNGEQLSKYVRYFTVDSKHVALSAIKAQVEDGVLTITIPKKEKIDPVTINVKALNPPSDDESVDVFRLFTIDLPGVKVDALKVKLHDGKINIEAERSRGDCVFKIYKAFTIDDEKVDTTTVEGYLVDGVLALFARRKVTEDNSNHHSSTVQKIEVNGPSSEVDKPLAPEEQEKSDASGEDSLGEESYTVVETVKEDED